MILSKDVYDKCSAAYQKVIDEFEVKIADIKSQDGIDGKTKAAHLDSIIDEYVKSYYIPMEYWSHLYKLKSKDSKASPPSKKVVERYEAMRVLYSKIKDAEDDVDQWFNLLLEVGIDDFVTQNMEYRIVGNLNDDKLWKIYIGYLKDVNPKKMLLWYSKYCRFFLDDLEMKEKYRDEMTSYGRPIKLPWRNLFDFEKALDQNEDDTVTETYGDTVNAKSNENIMYYIRKNADHMVLRKLYQSCKHFFEKKSAPVCYAFSSYGTDDIESWTTFDNEKLKCVNDICKPEVLKNLYITTVFHFNYLQLPTDYISKEIVPLLYRCDAKYVELYGQNLSFAELLFFIGHGNVVDLCLKSCEIKDVDGRSLILLEKIMERLPNVKRIKLHPIKCGENTGHALAKMKFSEKIFEMDFGFIGERFDPDQFKNFCITNRAEQQFSLAMNFSRNNFGEEFVQKIKNRMEDCEKSCENTRIIICSYLDIYLNLWHLIVSVIRN
uniref:Uncharacterized protein n=1 Tax=Panagrolaimus sp. ES5 TaxID=591445 RepID=A0AC34FSL0_9BILA